MNSVDEKKSNKSKIRNNFKKKFYLSYVALLIVSLFVVVVLIFRLV